MSEYSTSTIELRDKSSGGRYYESLLMAYVLGMAVTVTFIEKSGDYRLEYVIACFIFFITIGTPLTIFELSMGQYTRKGLVRFMEICPPLYGIAYISYGVIFAYIVDYVVLGGILLRYVFNTCLWNSGWGSCTNLWNTEYCYTLTTNFSRLIDCYEIHGEDDCNKGAWESSYRQFYFNQITHETSDDTVYMTSMMHSTMFLLCLTIILYKGKRFLEKCCAFLLLGSAVCFFILFYFTLTQPGAGEGLKKVLIINTESITEPKMWISLLQLTVAATGIGTGGLQFFGSENRFRGNSYMNGWLIILVLITVAVVELMLYVSLCGCYSYYMNHPVDEIFSDEEPYLYATVPKMLEALGGSKLWFFLYFTHIFLMVTTATLMLAFLLIKSTYEVFPKTENYPRKTIIILMSSIFLIILPLMTSYGALIWIIIDSIFVKGPGLTMLPFIKIGVVVYVYGLSNAIDDIHFMLGFRMPLHWQVVLFFSPVLLFVLWILDVIESTNAYVALPYLTGHSKELLLLSLFATIVIIITYAIWNMRKRIRKCKFKNAFSPSDSWYLSDQVLRMSREMFSSSNMTEEYLYRQSKRREILRAHEMTYVID